MGEFTPQTLTISCANGHGEVVISIWGLIYSTQKLPMWQELAGAIGEAVIVGIVVPFQPEQILVIGVVLPIAV